MMKLDVADAVRVAAGGGAVGGFAARVPSSQTAGVYAIEFLFITSGVVASDECM